VGCSSGKTLFRDGTAIVPSVVSIHPFGNLSGIGVLHIVLAEQGFFQNTCEPIADGTGILRFFPPCAIDECKSQMYSTRRQRTVHDLAQCPHLGSGIIMTATAWPCIRADWAGKELLPSLQPPLPSSATHPSGPVPARNADPDLLKSNNKSKSS
jgi:hypothetical protein